MRKENSTNSINERSLLEFCKAHKALSQISGRWKLSLLFALYEEDLNYASFKSILPDISDRILAKQLKELVEDQIVENKKDKVQSLYILTEKGKKIVTTLTALGAIDET
ncbi:winged helix-turn-helix transcriptional regulator [Sphingobacterium sp. MYb388]|uniref:winged helix-turn-helix transcriptional regulator n=1 Tax=Sphingobacterium sp. MYb388 TaxID=2745437 RepID=UPI003095DE7C